MAEDPEYLLEAERRQPDAPAARPTRTGHVLVVDDDRDVLVTLAAVLQAEGHEVVPAHSGADAINALKAQSFDVLVVDLRLSDEPDGLSLLSTAMQGQPELIGIVLTGYGSLESAIEALHAGAFSYLLKPCNVDQLKAAVLRGLEKRAMADALRELQHAATRAVEDRAQAQLRELEQREAEAREMAARALERVAHLQAITSQLTRHMEPDKLLEQVVHAAAQLLESPIAAVFLLSDPDGDFECSAAEGLDRNLSLRLPRQRSLGAQAIAKRTTVAVDDVRKMRGIALPTLSGGSQVGSIIVAPIWDDQTPLGVVEVYTPNPHRWDEDEIDLLSALAAAAGVALVSVRMHEELQRAMRTRDEVLASVTHDLKTPLTTISGVAQLLRRREAADGAGDGQVLSGLDTIHKMAGTMASLIDELMDTVRLQHGEPLELHVSSCDLVALAHEVIEDHRRTAPAHELSLDSPAELAGQWDAQRLRRVLDNLLSNAVKYSPRGGKITLRLAREGNEARLTIQDRGIGIRQDDLPLLFEPFKRGQNVGRIAGSGVGLVGVKRIVELHGGSIAVESSRGHGTTFTIRLPLRQGVRLR